MLRPLSSLSLVAVLLATGLLTIQPAAAQQGLTALQSGDAPLTIDADEGIEWQRDQQAYIARGNALATRGDLSIRANTLTAYYRDKASGGGTEIYRLDALGNVIISSANETVYGQKGVYSVDQRVVQLTGNNLRLETATDVVKARDSLEYWEDYNGRPVAVARGEASAERLVEKQRILSDVLTATFSQAPENGNLELDQVDAFGDVRLSTEKDFARGDKGIYYVKKQEAVLDGNVRITSSGNQLNGDRAEIDLETGVSRLLSAGNSRVRGLLKSQDTN
ncbi:LptA/OstA family protein [Rhodovibrionaceae bacterium A322]